ncbi:GGDEF domain-containing protein [Vibrio ouci]|uniref:diguanylate cyclase n=1 Tax=Vibrio ouci TaxID=2499078 RepID=A0A4Y8WL92_9VIBR|nr:GGDEF domain-containing protein [Vibrio ouci]TFH93466.1 GGDEF domain-containing protein [Vibrio ouci]
MQLLKWESRQLSVLYIDIDGFKQFNDQHGHQLGDDLLRQFAVTLQELIEPCDHVVRWGGEEFLIFCPELDVTQGCELAELIRQRTMNSEWFNNVKLTCSIGVAKIGRDGYQNAIIKADEALFSAKSKGGNRVELAENKAITMTELEVFV